MTSIVNKPTTSNSDRLKYPYFHHTNDRLKCNIRHEAIASLISMKVMAKDLYHDLVKRALELVKRALEKDGWEITHDPYELRVGGVEMYIDIGAEQIIGADRGNDKIAVEVKSFISPSRISDFHLAHGQFLDYRYALEEVEPERILYLAVPDFVYRTFFNLAFVNRVIQRSQLNLLVYDLDKESIEQWIK